MFIPIHLGNHWCITCINFINKTVKYYDRLCGKNPKCLNIIFNYLKEEHKKKKKKKNKTFDERTWQLMKADD
jgi:sentrin-specific protease 1